MSEQNALESKPAQSIPERPKEESKDQPTTGDASAAAPAEDGEKGPSKNALKKAQKEKEKV